MLNLFKEWLFHEETSHKFACVMARLPDFKQKIIKWGKKNIPEDLWIKEEHDGLQTDTHVTVLYGLHSNSIEDVKPVLKKFKPFELELTTISKFEAPNFDVLKIGVKSSKLHEMNKELKKLPYTSKFPIYVPHCTIAYVKKDSCNKLIGNKEFDGLKCKISEVTFSPSEGQKINIKL